MNKPNWNDAPKSARAIATFDHNNELYWLSDTGYWLCGDESDFLPFSMQTNPYSCNFDREDFKIIETRPDNLVYTQEMHDAGVLPLVGSSVLYYVCNPDCVTQEHIKHHNVEMDVVAIDNQLIVLLSKDKCFATACNDSWIKPIKPPVKLIDGKAYQFDYDDITTHGIYRVDEEGYFVYHCFNSISASKCKNIKPLVVEE